MLDHQNLLFCHWKYNMLNFMSMVYEETNHSNRISNIKGNFTRCTPNSQGSRALASLSVPGLQLNIVN